MTTKLMTRKTLLLGTLAGSLGLATPALAQEWQNPIAEGYVGGSFGYHTYETEEFPDSREEFDNFEDEHESWKVRAGAQFSEVWGIEAGYTDFGEVADDRASFEAAGVTAGVTAALPLTPKFAPYAKGGYMFWDRNGEDRLLGSRDDDGEDPYYGVGLRVGLSEQLDMRVEYDRYALDEADVDMASVGLNYLF